MSPVAPGSRLVIVTAAGARSGRDRNSHRSPRTRGAAGRLPGGIVPAGVAIWNWNVPFLVPSMFRDVLTVTVSPGANGVVGMKLPPSPSESASTEPLWAPLDEPVTVIVPN